MTHHIYKLAQLYELPNRLSQNQSVFVWKIQNLEYTLQKKKSCMTERKSVTLFTFSDIQLLTPILSQIIQAIWTKTLLCVLHYGLKTDEVHLQSSFLQQLQTTSPSICLYFKNFKNFLFPKKKTNQITLFLTQLPLLLFIAVKAFWQIQRKLLQQTCLGLI